jgi:predicted cupin superfamily sugar epimerase
MPDHSRRDIMAGAALAGAAALTSSPDAMAQGTSMHQGMSYDDVRKLLNLEPNATCGYVRVTFVSPQRIAPGGLPAPFADGRPMGSALYFMLTPEEPVKLHRIRNDQFYHYYLGDPIEVLMLMTDGSTQHHVVGPDLRAGQKVQLFIPGNTFHTARVIGSRRWFLGGSTEWPGVEPADVELGKMEELAAKYPSVAEQIRTYPLPAKG